MHLVIAHMSARYSGRGETYLAPHDRILIVKADGAVAVHGDKGHKPFNYMMATAEKVESFVGDDKVWTFDAPKESLSIRFHHIYSEFTLAFEAGDPGLIKDRTEAHLQHWLATHLPTLDSTLLVEAREYQTGDGPVDLLAYRQGRPVAVEVKRVATMNAVGQVLRYRDALQEMFQVEVEPLIAAVEFKAKTLQMAAKKGVTCLPVPSDWHGGQDELALAMGENLPPQAPEV